MKKSFISLGLCSLLAFVTAGNAFAAKPWAEVKAPEITGIEQSGPNELTVKFNLLTSADGADKGTVLMTSSVGAKKEVAVGKTRKEAKIAKFEVQKTGKYTFVVTGERNNEKTKITSAEKSFDYILPLVKADVTVRNIGGGKMAVNWTSVPEAEGYVLSYTVEGGKKVSNPQTKDLFAEIEVPLGVVSEISVTAVRGSDSSVASLKKTSRPDAERIWKFTEFGTSTNPARNNYELLDSDNMKVKLNSCTFDPKTNNVIDKGGKFESFFDGISFYYTKIDPRKENFEITCTVTVDYHNPIADGQEGFGVLALDQLGVEGDPLKIAYNNSTGIVSKKMTDHVEGKKMEIKNGIGYRQVVGITPEIIAEGDAAISQKCKSTYKAFSYDASDMVKTGDVYRVTFKKDNTGYHSIYKRAIPSIGTVEEYIMYDTTNEKLLKLDKNFIYVGFAVARGCNATFSDVVFKTSDPAKDAPAEPEPPTLIPLNTQVDSPTVYSDKKYPFTFLANSDGTIHIENKYGDVLVKKDKVKANEYYKKTLKIDIPGITDLFVTFTPDASFMPTKGIVLMEGEKLNTAIAQFNRETLVYEKNYNPVHITHSVSCIVKKGKVIYVSPEGTIFGDGTQEKPIDLDTAFKYLQPGQTALVLPGKYYPKGMIEIERGNSGTKKAKKVIKAADPANHPVIDFGSAQFGISQSAGISLYGDYWVIENIDVTKTPGDVKGIQVGGSYNELRMVDAYLNGDTGIQISGKSSEDPVLWPHDNLVYGCESFGNSDPSQNNADGFACKLTSGVGNVFRNCVSHHNVDDGWDLYAKVETGPIGAVLIDNCIAYANGTKLDLSGKGDGNGFKLGGDGIAVKHVLRNSVSWGNGTNGVTCNSNPALILDHVTIFGSASYNISLYGKGNKESAPRTFEVTGALSCEGGAGDSFDSSNDPELAGRLASDTNFFFNGATPVNKSGTAINYKEAFVSTDTSIYYDGYTADKKGFNRIPRDANGYFQLGNLFKLTDKVPAGVGADYNHTNAALNAK